VSECEHAVVLRTSTSTLTFGCRGAAVGEKRIVTVPPSKAYSTEGHEGSEAYEDWPSTTAVPPNATLTYEVECSTVAKIETRNLFFEMDIDGDGGLTQDELQSWFMENEDKDAPLEIMEQDDVDPKDGHISWKEFTLGEKGKTAPAATFVGLAPVGKNEEKNSNEEEDKEEEEEEPATEEEVKKEEKAEEGELGQSLNFLLDADVATKAQDQDQGKDEENVGQESAAPDQPRGRTAGHSPEEGEDSGHGEASATPDPNLSYDPDDPDKGRPAPPPGGELSGEEAPSAASAAVTTAGGRDGGENSNDMFSSLDADRDGRIDKEEIRCFMGDPNVERCRSYKLYKLVDLLRPAPGLPGRGGC
jgi:Ca2+-binding EF-hand superfamily protein